MGEITGFFSEEKYKIVENLSVKMQIFICPLK